ncbi:30S ribosomal protein S20 [Buchnera aphidicola]|uniref:30S ribosomal protein S20 n=1 Tax=Buchnera aphidicola TaxID=9 RepID=UPI00346464A4
MSNIKSSQKHAIKSKKRRNHNFSRKSMLRTFMKKFSSLINTGDLVKIKNLFHKLQSLLDRFSRKGLIHKNKASRHKSRLFLKIKHLSGYTKK